MRAVILNVPDNALSIAVLTDRTTLRAALVDAFGKHDKFSKIDNAFAIYASSLKYADPFLGGTVEAHIQAMRTAEVELKRVIRGHVQRRWYWLLRRQDPK